MNNDRTETINMTVENTNEDINFAIRDTGTISFEIEKNNSDNDYEKLFNQPQINSITLLGNKTGDELNLQEKGDYANTRVTNIEIDALFR